MNNDVLWHRIQFAFTITYPYLFPQLTMGLALLLGEEVRTWEEERNAAVVKVDWQFTTADARVRLKKLYPTIELQ
jgi:cytochrome bd-type quinol oxidase subunit 1